MYLKYSACAVALICLGFAGCQTANSVWTKPGYVPAPVTNGASRTYTPTEAVSPYQQGPSSYGGSAAR